MLIYRVTSLKEQIQSYTNQHKSEIQDLNNQIKELKSSLEEEHKIIQRESTAKQELENLLSESQQTIEELNAKVTELENNKPNPGMIHTHYLFLITLNYFLNFKLFVMYFTHLVSTTILFYMINQSYNTKQQNAQHAFLSRYKRK